MTNRREIGVVSYWLNSIGRFVILGGIFAITAISACMWLVEMVTYMTVPQFQLVIARVMYGWPTLVILATLWTLFGSLFVIKIKSQIIDLTLFLAIFVITSGLKFTTSESRMTQNTEHNQK